MRLAALLLSANLAGCVSAPVDAVSRGTMGVHALVDQKAAKHGIPSHIAHGVVRVESRYRCDARNGVHAGAMQVKPATARSVGVTGNLFTCEHGIEAGMRYLRLALDRGGVGCAGVSFYNRGIYARSICTGYGRKVLGGAS